MSETKGKSKKQGKYDWWISKIEHFDWFLTKKKKKKKKI